MGFGSEVWHQLTVMMTLLVILAPAAVGDYQHHRLPNSLSMSGWIIGPVIGFAFASLSGLGDALLGLAFMVVIMFPLWMVRWFGAADVKLLGSVGAIAGFDMAPTILLGVTLTGALVSMAILIYQRRLGFLLFQVLSGELFKSLKNSTRSQQDENSTEGPVIPYAIPIAFGTMLTILYMQF